MINPEKTRTELLERTRESEKNRQSLLRDCLLRTPEQRRCLAHILDLIGWLNKESPSIEAAIRENIAKDLLADLGIWVPGNTAAILEALSNVPPRSKLGGVDIPPETDKGKE